MNSAKSNAKLSGSVLVDLPYSLLVDQNEIFKFHIDFVFLDSVFDKTYPSEEIGKSARIEFNLKVLNKAQKDLLGESNKENNKTDLTTSPHLPKYTSTIRIDFCSESIRTPLPETNQTQDHIKDMHMVNTLHNWLFDTILTPAINRYLEIYRYVTNDEMMRNLGPLDLVYRKLRVKINDEDFPVGNRILTGSFKDLAFAGTIRKTMNNNSKEVKRLLEEDFEVPLYQNALINARYFLQINQYRMAIIEGGISLEAFLQYYLRKQYQTKGHTEEKICSLLDKASVSKMMRLLRKIMGNKLRGSNEFRKLWKNWSWSNELRNNVVHGQVKQVYRQQAEVYVETVESLIQFFTQ